MLETIFQTLNNAMHLSPAAALTAAFVWGILSVLLSPCHLAGIPLIIAYVDNQNVQTTRHATGLSVLFAVGLLVTMAVIGIITALAGRIMGDVGAFGGYLMSAVFLFIGLHLLGVLSIPWFGTNKERVHKKGALGALLLGLLFGIASGPCTFAFLAPILAVVFATANENMLFAISLLILYAIGHSIVLVLAGISAERIQHIKKWNKESIGSKLIKNSCGILLLLAGLYFLYRSV